MSTTRLKLQELINRHIGTDGSEYKHDDLLETLGLDSLAAIHISHQLLLTFGLDIHPDELFETSFNNLLERTQRQMPYSVQALSATKTTKESKISPALSVGTKPARTAPTNIVRATLNLENSIPIKFSSGRFSDPFDILAQSDAIYAGAARNSGFTNYWDRVAPIENDLVHAYITEAFASLGVDLPDYPCGTEIPDIPHLSKYDRLMKRLLNILESRYFISIRKGRVLRGSDRIEIDASSELCETLRKEHPQFEYEAKLLSLIGPRLADCISGRTDPVSILFGSAASRHIMEDFYSKAPMMAAHREQLVFFLARLMENAATDFSEPINILEVGAGTGGTTAGLINAFVGLKVPVRYTFTDIGLSFVNNAKNRWGNIPWMNFAPLNIEEEMPRDFRGRFDIVLGANVVHATADRAASCQRLREALRPSGLLVLSEVTRVIDWYDICFGLLDGWWMADGENGYAIQPASVWRDAFYQAGFESVGQSTGESEEALSQQLLVARK
ncbi:hypothetical protein QQS21_008660 [Conoideocrella luteorostrata]|uniref:Polyketide synthase n=1 Tax=Conoideocrella luteorostrata TaxID=1105319 RepID=A0AAJ0CII5_9HYPO|nr:hypothetical protein QQS21_008660 [Conoideocrella luteorostrata]